MVLAMERTDVMCTTVIQCCFNVIGCQMKYMRKQRRTLKNDWCSEWSTAIHLFFISVSRLTVFFSSANRRRITQWHQSTLPLVSTFRTRLFFWSSNFKNSQHYFYRTTSDIFCLFSLTCLSACNALWFSW